MRFDTLSQQHTNFDVNMAWDITTIDSHTIIDGVISNVRYSRMEDLEIWVDYLDANDKTVSRAVDLLMPKQLNINNITTFRVIFKTVVPHDAKLVFTYKYYGYDGGDGTQWMQSFESNAP